jgi:hypothetical protein
MMKKEKVKGNGDEVQWQSLLGNSLVSQKKTTGTHGRFENDKREQRKENTGMLNERKTFFLRK